MFYTPRPMCGDASRKWTWTWVLALAVVALGHCAYYAPRTVDDMFIFLRYAENLAAGRGPVYNPGEAVEGFSSPLWVVLLALGERLGLGGISWAKFLALGSFGLLLGGTHRFAREVVGASPRVAIASCFALALNSYVVSWTLWGLETPLHLALMLWASVLACRVALDGNRRDSLALAFVGTSFVWGRPEAPLFIALIGLGVLLAGRGWRSIYLRLRHCAWPAGAVIGAWLLLMVGRRLYFGLWLPHTHYAKQGQGFEVNRLLALVADGSSQLEVAVLACGVAACLWLVARRRPLPLLLVLGNVFFVSVVVLDWMPNIRHFLPLTILFPMVALAAADRLFERGGGFKVVAALGALLVVTNAINLVRTDSRYSRSSFASHGRGKQWIRPKTLEVWSDTWACLRHRRPPHIDRMDDFNHGMISQLYRMLESDARPLSESWYVARDIGRVGWLSDAKVFDTDGLLAPPVVQSQRWLASRQVDEALISKTFARNVTMTELFGSWAHAAARSPAVRKSYQPIQGNWSYLRPRDGHRPAPQQILDRYEAALEKMPSSYYVMTLYGEAVGAALDRRTAHVRFNLGQGPTIDKAPGGLSGGPVVLDGNIEMLGCVAEPAAVSPGEAFTLSCYFRALAQVLRDYTVFVHFEGPGGRPRINADHPPAGGFYPTRDWTPGQLVRSAVRIRMPEAATTMRAYVGLFIGGHRAKANPAGPLVDQVGRVIGPEVRVK